MSQPLIPNKYARKLADQLLPEAQRDAFLGALSQGASSKPAVLWLGERPAEGNPFLVEPPVAWQPDFVDAMASGERPGRHALHNEGAFYCLDLSSVFEASAVCGLPVGGTVIDVCAAPGGKAIFAWRALAPERLVANEIIGKRLGALHGNLRRCGVPAETRNADPATLALEFSQQGSLVLVDAPCSGQSLLARGQENPGAFHPVTVGGCSGRQKRILAESSELVAPGGFLVYSTCTYAREENEAVVTWFLSRFPEFAAVTLATHAPHQSSLVSYPCYRLWPQEGLGAGGFVALLHRQ